MDREPLRASRQYLRLFLIVWSGIVLAWGAASAHAQASSRSEKVDQIVRSIETTWDVLERNRVAPLRTQKFRWAATELMRRTGVRLKLGEAWTPESSHWQSGMQVIISDLEAQTRPQPAQIKEEWAKFAEQLAALGEAELDDAHRFYTGPLFRKVMVQLGAIMSAIGVFLEQKSEGASAAGIEQRMRSLLLGRRSQGMSVEDQRSFDAALESHGMRAMARNQADIVDYLLNNAGLFQLPPFSKPALQSFASTIQAFRNTPETPVAPVAQAPEVRGTPPQVPSERRLPKVIVIDTRAAASELTAAVIKNDTGRIKELAQSGSDVNTLDSTNFGKAPLHEAAESGNLGSVRALLESGANVNIRRKNGTTPLHLAAARNRRAVVEYLIERGADINAVDHNWGTPLHAAVLQGNEPIVALLIAKGADVNARSIDRRTTPIHEIGRAANIYPSHERILKLLIDAGADTSSLDAAGLPASSLLRRGPQ